MAQLNYEVLRKSGYEGFVQEKGVEKVMQFGEGNFLRAFVDDFFDIANEKAGWNGKVVLVQPIGGGLSELINRQQGLYTLYLRGSQNGRKVDEKRVISACSRCLKTNMATTCVPSLPPCVPSWPATPVGTLWRSVCADCSRSINS